MFQKYHHPQVMTNDLYLAAFLLCRGCTIGSLVINERRRISFVLTGKQVHALRAEYNRDSVILNLRSYRDQLRAVRQRMDAEQRSIHGPDSRERVGAAETRD